MYLQNDDGLWGICPEGLRTYQGARRSASPRLQVSSDYGARSRSFHIIQQIIYHRAYGLKSEISRPRQNIRTDSRHHRAGGYVQMREKGNEQSSPVRGGHSNVQESRVVFGVQAVYRSMRARQVRDKRIEARYA